MTDEVASIQYAKTTFPEGTGPVDHVSIVLTDASGNITKKDVSPDTPSADLGDLPDGTYGYSVQAFDASGAGIGQAIVGQANLSGPKSVELSLPEAVTFAPGAAPP